MITKTECKMIKMTSENEAVLELVSTIEKFEEALRDAEKHLKPAHDHCEAIALSSLLPSDHDDAESFFRSQATKSVGSGGRAYHNLEKVLADIRAVLAEYGGEGKT